MSGVFHFVFVVAVATLSEGDLQVHPQWNSLDDDPSLALLQIRSEVLRPQGIAEPQRATLAADYAGSTQALGSEQAEALLSEYDSGEWLSTSEGLDGAKAAEPARSKEWPATVVLAYPLAMMCVACMISVIYWPRGLAVVFMILAYVFALSTMKLCVKYVFTTKGFAFPKFLTAVHFVASSVFGFAVLHFRSRAKGGKEIVVPSFREATLTIFPIALSFAVSIGATNMALGFCSVAFSEIVGSTQPIYTVAVLLALGVEFDARLLLPVLVVVFGCGLSVTGAAEFSTVGFALVGVGNLARAVKGAGQQVLMTGETRERFEPLTLLAWMCLAASAVMLLFSGLTEGAAPYHKLGDNSGTLVAIAVSAVNACALNLTSLHVLRELGAVGIILVGQTKAVLTVLGGVVLFGEEVSEIQCIGFAVVLLGTFAYSNMESSLKQKAALGKS